MMVSSQRELWVSYFKFLTKERNYSNGRKQNMENKVYENNGGGLIMIGDDEGVAGLEFAIHGEGVEDIMLFGIEWFVSDIGGNTIGYHADGNTCGDRNEDGSEIDYNDLCDDVEKSKLVAEYDGKTLILYVADMGAAAHKYFGISND